LAKSIVAFLIRISQRLLYPESNLAPIRNAARQSQISREPTARTTEFIGIPQYLWWQSGCGSRVNASMQPRSHYGGMAGRARTRTGAHRTNTATPKPLAALAPRMRVLLVLHQNPLDHFQREIAYHRWQPGRSGNREPGSPSRVRPKPAGLLVELLLLGRHGHSNAGFALAST